MTHWLALLGRGSGLALTAFGALSLAGGDAYWTALVGGPFLWWAANQEEQAVLIRSMRQLLRKRQGVASRRIIGGAHLVALADVRLAEILPHLAIQRFHTVLVVDADLRVRGTVTETQILAAFQQSGPEMRLLDMLQ